MKTALYFTLTLLTFVTLTCVPKSFAQDSRPIVRLIYFVPSDRSAQPNIDDRMDKLIKDAQQIFAGQMEHYGFGRKTFQFETDAIGKAVVHHVNGKFKDKFYQRQSGKVWDEIKERFDTSINIYLAALETGTEDIDGFACGTGGATDPYGGIVLIPASGWCFEEIDVTVHELGHAFGLLHDFRNNLQPWIDLYSTEPMTTSACAAEWLNGHRYFNDHQIYVNEPTIIRMLPRAAVHSDSIRFQITDSDGLHQVQLFVIVKYLNGRDQGILDCKSLDGSSNIVEFSPAPLVMMADSEPLQVITDLVVLRVIDGHGNFTHHEFPIDVTRLLSRGEVVSIPDANLAAVVRETLGLARRRPITQQDMLKLTSLQAPKRQITDLTGLTHTKNLKSLNLEGNQIRDVTPLAGLPQLEFLDLRQNQISDIRPLMGVRRLKNLKFADNPILDTAVQLQALRQNNPDLGSDADPKIEGPWLWMIVPTREGASSDPSRWKDWLAAASNNSVTEAQIATNGAIVGGRVKNRVWTSGKLAPAGGNNIGEMVNTIGLGRDLYIDDHVAYGSIILKSPREQNTRMYAGSDDNHKVWLNGELVHEQLDWRWAHDYQGSFPVTLRRGKNVLLVAIRNVGGLWGGYFGFESGTTYSITTPTVHIESAERPPMYWIDAKAGTLHRLINDKVENLVSSVQNAISLAVDMANEKLYWAEKTSNTTGKIRRANLDGTNVQLVKDLTSAPLDIALDTVSSKLYLTNSWGKVQRLNFDGTDFQTNLITSLKSPTDITLDVKNSKVYWIENASSIRQANLDGSEIKTVVTDLGTPEGITVANNKIYWTEQISESIGRIQHADLNGENVETVATIPGAPHGIAVDTAMRKLYWTNAVGGIQRAGFAGNNIQNLVTELPTPGDFALHIRATQILVAVSQRPPMYWVDAEVGALYRLAGAIVENIVPSVQNATSLAVDGVNSKLYWTEKTSDRTGKIRRANLNGTNVELIKDLTSVPHSIVVDAINSQLYLTNSWGKVQRLNFDGTNFEPNLITGLDSPQNLILDVANSKVYWTESSGRIRRAHLDGSNLQSIGTYLGTLSGIAIASGKVYWTEETDGKSGKIQRANLDGTNIETLATLTNVPFSIAVNVAERKLYWANAGGEIQRANLNGSNIENLVTGLSVTPVNIALGIAATDTVIATAPTAVGVAPDETLLHPNYPNPFNPETWIPYQLSKPAEVSLHIYAVNGTLVRTLALGHQATGMYQSRSRAAYWDGRNAFGEPVASGIYFYTLTADDFSATRKMLIRK